MNELFRTPVSISKNRRAINLPDDIVMIGSCFSDNIYSKLKINHFRAFSNPTGVIYNPLSIMQLLDRLIIGKRYTSDDLFFADGYWKSFDHHTSFDHQECLSCLQRINSEFDQCVSALKNLHTLILTLGSAFVYRHIENNRIVANCHKLPGNTFTRELASIDKIVDVCKDVFAKLLIVNPSLNIILTVSPVRHLRDKSHENTVSKAHLISAIYQLETIFNQVYYFPAYELMMDELRDYRFYSSDMIHPSDTAIDFIWDRFCDTCIDKRAAKFIERYKQIIAARNHRITHFSKESVAQFFNSQLFYIDSLKKDFPEIDLSEDYHYFSAVVK